MRALVVSGLEFRTLAGSGTNGECEAGARLRLVMKPVGGHDEVFRGRETRRSECAGIPVVGREVASGDDQSQSVSLGDPSGGVSELEPKSFDAAR